MALAWHWDPWLQAHCPPAQGKQTSPSSRLAHKLPEGRALVLPSSPLSVPESSLPHLGHLWAYPITTHYPPARSWASQVQRGTPGMVRKPHVAQELKKHLFP